MLKRGKRIDNVYIKQKNKYLGQRTRKKNYIEELYTKMVENKIRKMREKILLMSEHKKINT